MDPFKKALFALRRYWRYPLGSNPESICWLNGVERLNGNVFLNCLRCGRREWSCTVKDCPDLHPMPVGWATTYDGGIYCDQCAIDLGMGVDAQAYVTARGLDTFWDEC
jgi:hypothetical protein